jgi:MFS family permease
VLKRAGIDNPRDIGLLSFIPFLIGFIAQYLCGQHSDHTGERRKHAFIPGVLAALGWALLPLMQNNPWMSLVLLTVATAGTFAAMGPFWALPQTLLTGAAAPAGIAMVTTIAGFGNFVSPILVGWLADKTGSLAAGQYYYGAVLLIGAAAVLLPSRKA